MVSSLAAEVGARTHSTLSSAIRLRESVASKNTSPEWDPQDELGQVVVQLGSLLSRIERTDFSLGREQEWRSIQDDLRELHGLIDESLPELRMLVHAEEYDRRFLEMLEDDHGRLASIIDDISLFFSGDFRGALKRVVSGLAPSGPTTDWRKALGSVPD